MDGARDILGGLPEALLETPAARRALMAGALEARRAALAQATRLLAWGQKLLVAVIAVSFLHAWESVAAIRPSMVAPLALPEGVYHVAAAAFTLAIDLVALYTIAAAPATAIAGLRAPRWPPVFFLGVTLLLNAAFVVRYAPSLPDAWRARLLPLLEASFVALLPAFVMLAILALEGAQQRLSRARLTLLAETRALAELLADDADAQPPTAPLTVRRAPLPQQSGALPCPRCAAPLTLAHYLAARRDGACPACRGQE